MTTAQQVKVTYERPPLYPKQRDCFFNDARISAIEASTKSGKTHGAICWLNEQAWVNGGRGKNFVWVAPVLDQARVAFNRWTENLTPNTFVSTQSPLVITLMNGSTIYFKSGDNPDSLYGEDYTAAVIDEASRCKEGSWHAIRSTLTATRGPIRVIGNVRGSKNWAYHLARRAETEQGREEGLAYHRITAYDAIQAGVLDQEEVDSAQRDLPPEIFKELYLAIPSADGGNPFGADAIQSCIRPISTNSPRVFGWDLAKSQDYTVGIGLDGEWTVSRFHRWQHEAWPATTERIVEETQVVPALVDSTGLGDVVLDHLQRDGRGRYEGFKFSVQSKQELMRRLQMAIQRGEVHFPRGVIVEELESFEYQYTQKHVIYSAPAGLHDDCVMALALAVYHATERRVTNRESKPVFLKGDW